MDGHIITRGDASFVPLTVVSMRRFDKVAMMPAHGRASEHVQFVLGLAFASLGLSIVILGIWMRRMSVRATSWPSIEGEIVDSRLEPDAHDGDSSVRIRYRYTVDGRRYESGQVSYAGHARGRQYQALVERYRPGLKIPVYYDPTRPSRAVIERQLTNYWLWMLGVGAVFIVVAFVS